MRIIDGVLHLGGEVHSEERRDRLTEGVRRAEPGVEVRNEVSITAATAEPGPELLP